MLSLAEALAELPDTADGIANHLIVEGIRGVREMPNCCPVANYLTRAGFHLVEVTADEVTADEVTADDGWRRIETPNGVASFVLRFDQGEWPELVDEPEADDV